MTLRERLGDTISGGALSEMAREVAAVESGLNYLQNEFGQMQAAQGWVAQGEAGGHQFNRAQVRAIAQAGTAMYWANSLIKRGVSIQADYVFGQGFTVSSPDKNVQKVLSGFMGDLRNRAVITEPEAAARREVELQCEGNLFLAAFTGQGGDVSVRALDACTIENVVRNPEDMEEPWYYQRIYTTEVLQADGTLKSETKTVYHPDVNYNPPARDRFDFVGGHEVMWDAPLFHFKPGALLGQKFGICEFYSAQKPAASYEKFLGHRMKVAEALSRFCLKFISKGTDAVKGAADMAAGLAARMAAGRSRAGDKRGDEENVANGAILTGGNEIEAVNVKGATISPDDGRRQQLMSHSGFGFPETFWSDASVGSLATAQSLDRPTALKIERRRRFWADVISSLALFAVIAAIKAGTLVGKVEYRGNTPLVTVEGKPVEIEVAFPDVIEHDVTNQLDAIAKAAPLIPDDELIAEQAMKALRIKNAPERLKKMKFPTPGEKAKAAADAQAKADQAKSQTKEPTSE